MSNENASSNTIATLDELNKLIDTTEIGTIYTVVGENNADYILVDDINGHKYWSNCNGKNKEECLKFNDWFKEGQKMFQNEAAPKEFLEKMREVMLAISVLGNFYTWDEETVAHLVDTAIVKLAYERFCTVKGYTGDIASLEGNGEFHPYIHMITLYAKSFLALVQEVRANAEQAQEDKQTIPEEPTVVNN